MQTQTIKESMTSNTIIFDIETNGLLLDVTTLWVGVAYSVVDKKLNIFYDATELTNYLIKDPTTTLVGHNICGYDIPALEKLTGIRIKNPCIDTMILAKLMHYDKDKSWKFSLDAYGARMDFAKGHYDDWSKYTQEMEDYCIQDVRVTKRLFDGLLLDLEDEGNWLPFEALDIEQKCQRIISDQYMNGWYFDLKAAQKLHVELMKDLEESERELNIVFKPLFYPTGKETVPAKPYKRDGISYVGPHQKVLLLPFNPGSSNHVVWWIDKLYGEQNWDITEKGNPSTSRESLIKLFTGFNKEQWEEMEKELGEGIEKYLPDKEWFRVLLHYFEVKKLLGQLADGPKAWLKKVGDDSRIHGSLDILGTNTGRATHTDPNLGQVPAKGAYRGKDARKLFTVPKGKVLVGSDLSGVELRCLAHYMYPMDEGSYADFILQGDIHTVNQNAAGLPTRDMAKTFIYGLLYGGGDAKIGLIVGKGAKEGKKLKKQFFASLPALETLLEVIKKKAKQGYLTGISGRRISVRHSYSSPNALLQSLGAYISKYWMVEIHSMLDAEGIIAKQIGWVHDEVAFECEEKDAQRISEILIEAAVASAAKIGIRMRIDAESKMGKNWLDVH